MKRHSVSFATAVIALALVSVVVLCAFDAGASVAFGSLPLGELMTYVAPAVPAAAADLAALRTRHADLTTRAAAKRAEVKDGMAKEAVDAIEAAHAELVREAGEVATQIAAAEAQQRNQPPADPATPPAPGQQQQQRAHAWNTADISRINARATAFGLTAEQAIAVMGDANVRTVEAATDRLQELAAQRSQQHPQQRPHISISRDAGDTLRRSMESAIVLRASPGAIARTAPEFEMGRAYRGMSLMEMGRVFIEESQGIKLRNLGRMELATVLLGLETLGTRAAGMHSTSDFASLLANVAAKRLRAAYAAAPQTFKQFCRPSNNPDFKEKSVVQLSSAPAFKKVREGQEFSYGGLTDGVEKYALATFGRIVPISRQALINDDLSAFDRLPTMLGRAAADLESTTVWDVLLSNPTMGDGVALFHAEHGNLPAAAAIDETNLGLAEKAMRDQRGFAAKAADREYLNLTPKFLMVGNAKKIQAQKMLTAVTPNATSGVNTFQNSMDLIVEARITGNKWFLAADPAQVDTIEYSYLEGEEGVFVEERVGFEVDGIEVKGRLDFAAKAIDWRGLVYNSGA